MKLTKRSDAESAKTKNIVEMAFDFTAMTRVFCRGSKPNIVSKLEGHFSDLPKIKTREDYEDFHRQFCEWFTREIRTAQKSEPASYGHAAKVLDIAIKVYVYYCAQPNAEVAERLVPFLHGAIDTALLKHLKSACTTVKEVDEKAYEGLQSLVRAESQRCKVHPVQYDDIMFRKLNRKDDLSN